MKDIVEEVRQYLADKGVTLAISEETSHSLDDIIEKQRVEIKRLMKRLERRRRTFIGQQKRLIKLQKQVAGHADQLLAFQKGGYNKGYKDGVEWAERNYYELEKRNLDQMLRGE